MRESLKSIEDKRQHFSATFVRFGQKSGWNGRMESTLLFNDVTDDSGRIVADHVWFSLCKRWDVLNLVVGDVVGFDARVKSYIKGYKGYRDDVEKPLEQDYKLSHPSKVVLLHRL